MQTRYSKLILRLAVFQLLVVTVLGLLPNFDLFTPISLSMTIFATTLASFFGFMRMRTTEGAEKFGWLMIGIFAAGVFTNGIDNLFINSDDLVSPVAVSLLSIAFGVGILLILWNYLLPSSRKRLIVDTLYLTVALFLSLLYTAITPFYELDFANNIEAAAVLTLLAFFCVSVSLGVAIISQSPEHIRSFICLPIVSMTLILLATMKLVWIEVNNQTYSYFSYYDVGFHLSFISLMIWPHIKRPDINLDQVQPLSGIKSITFGPIVVLFPILFFSTPESSRLIIFVGLVLVAIMAFRVVTVNQENQDLNNTIRRMAELDHLTGALNRRGIHSYLDRVSDLSQFHLVYLDLDGFKAINDAHGHDVGDVLLSEFTERLRASLRPKDIVARVGGDEFIVLLEAVDRSTLEAIVSRIEKLSDIEYLVQEKLLSVGLTAAIVKGNEKVSAQELIRDADQLMLENKHLSKGTVAISQLDVLTA